MQDENVFRLYRRYNVPNNIGKFEIVRKADRNSNTYIKAVTESINKVQTFSSTMKKRSFNNIAHDVQIIKTPCTNNNYRNKRKRTSYNEEGQKQSKESFHGIEQNKDNCVTVTNYAVVTPPDNVTPDKEDPLILSSVSIYPT